MIRYCWDNIVVVWIYIGRYLPKEFGFNFFLNCKLNMTFLFTFGIFDNFSIYEMAEGAAEAEAEADKSIFLEFILSFNLLFLADNFTRKSDFLYQIFHYLGSLLEVFRIKLT